MATRPSLWQAIGRQLCPQCRRGKIHAGRIRLNPTCPVCGFRFEREEGYFTGAMYVSYVVTFPIAALLYFVIGRLTNLAWNSLILMGLTVLGLLPVVPWTIRFSRTVWLYLDYPSDAHW